MNSYVMWIDCVIHSFIHSSLISRKPYVYFLVSGIHLEKEIC